MRWATRFRGGAVRIAGRTEGGPLGDDLWLEPGEVELALNFVGGARPEIVELALIGGIRVGERIGSALDLDATQRLLDGDPVDLSTPADRIAEQLVATLHDVSARVDLLPDGDLLVKFQHGVQAMLSAKAVVSVEGTANGPPSALRLSRPLVMAVDGDGMRISHERFHRLASLASVRIEGASLHPDGEVRLRGVAHAVLDRVVQGGLDRASQRLSDLVRRSPRFARVRSFLAR